jgi:Holliday junction resolvase
MSAMQRNKGSRGERELLALLSDELGIVITRNLQQTRSGGADALDVPGWAIEVKRQETLSIASWWAQAARQANDLQRRPVLFYRQSRRPWKAVVDLHHVLPGTFPTPGNLAEIALDAACQIIRESLP